MDSECVQLEHRTFDLEWNPSTAALGAFAQDDSDSRTPLPLRHLARYLVNGLIDLVADVLPIRGLDSIRNLYLICRTHVGQIESNGPSISRELDRVDQHEVLN